MRSLGRMRNSLAGILRVSQLGLTVSPQLFFAVIAWTTGVVLVFLTPPLQVADERCHLRWRIGLKGFTDDELALFGWPYPR